LSNYSEGFLFWFEPDLSNYKILKLKQSYYQEPIEGTPNYLIIEVWLPGIESSSKLTLDVGEDRLTLHAHPAKYFLDIELPYDVVPMESGAQYDTEVQLLTVALMTTCAVELPSKPDRVISLDRERFLRDLNNNDN